MRGMPSRRKHAVVMRGSSQRMTGFRRPTSPNGRRFVRDPSCSFHKVQSISTMPEIWFYHLQHQPLEKVLPSLARKSARARAGASSCRPRPRNGSMRSTTGFGPIRMRAFSRMAAPATAMPRCSRSISPRALKIRMARGCASSSKAPMCRRCSRARPARLMNGSFCSSTAPTRINLTRRARAMEAAERAGPHPRLLAAGRTRRLGEEGVSRRTRIRSPDPPRKGLPHDDVPPSLDPASPEFKRAAPRRASSSMRSIRRCSGDDGRQFEAAGMVRDGL